MPPADYPILIRSLRQRNCIARRCQGEQVGQGSVADACQRDGAGIKCQCHVSAAIGDRDHVDCHRCPGGFNNQGIFGGEIANGQCCTGNDFGVSGGQHAKLKIIRAFVTKKQIHIAGD